MAAVNVDDVDLDEIDATEAPPRSSIKRTPSQAFQSEEEMTKTNPQKLSSEGDQKPKSEEKPEEELPKDEEEENDSKKKGCCTKCCRCCCRCFGKTMKYLGLAILYFFGYLFGLIFLVVCVVLHIVFRILHTLMRIFTLCKQADVDVLDLEVMRKSYEDDKTERIRSKLKAKEDRQLAREKRKREELREQRRAEIAKMKKSGSKKSGAFSPTTASDPNASRADFGTLQGSPSGIEVGPQDPNFNEEDLESTDDYSRSSTDSELEAYYDSIGYNPRRPTNNTESGLEPQPTLAQANGYGGSQAYNSTQSGAFQPSPSTVQPPPPPPPPPPPEEKKFKFASCGCLFRSLFACCGMVFVGLTYVFFSFSYITLLGTAALISMMFPCATECVVSAVKVYKSENDILRRSQEEDEEQTAPVVVAQNEEDANQRPGKA